MHNKSEQDLPLQLSLFDSLPDSANVRQPVVEGLFACSSATVWRWSKDGTIPAPRKLAPRVTVWNVGELRAVLNKRQEQQASSALVPVHPIVTPV